MKYKYFTYLLLAFILISAKTTKAQLCFGVHAGLATWLNTQGATEDGTPTGFFSPPNGEFLGIQLGYIFKPKMRVNFSVDFVSTQFEETTIPSPYTNRYGQPTSESIRVTAPGTMYRAEFQYAFEKDFLKNGLIFYGLAGVSCNTYYYTTNYEINGFGSNGIHYGDFNKTYLGWSLNMGAGLEYALNYTTRIFLDLRFCTGQKTSFDTSSADYSNFLPEKFNPFYLSSSIGLRFNLADEKE